jgi:hypothetical protein
MDFKSPLAHYFLRFAEAFLLVHRSTIHKNA